MFKDIIIAVTPSEVCDCAADTAFGFAQRFDAKLNLVHVVGLGQGWGHMEHLAADGTTERIKQEIDGFYKDKLKGISDYRITVVPGIPHNEVLRIARQDNADLIIMGPHTKEYEERRSKMWGMAGSTLERVAQKARCPVMIVTKQTPYGEQSFKELVVATDFSEQSECAVGYGAQLARHYKSTLTIFHCIEESDLSQPEFIRRSEAAKDRMRNQFEPLIRGLKTVQFECFEGKPAMEILKLSRMHQAGLVLMAHHSTERDPEKAYLGSVVAQVALNSTCPTMSINRHFDLRCGMMYDQTGGVTEKDKVAASA